MTSALHASSRCLAALLLLGGTNAVAEPTASSAHPPAAHHSAASPSAHGHKGGAEGRPNMKPRREPGAAPSGMPSSIAHRQEAMQHRRDAMERYRDAGPEEREQMRQQDMARIQERRARHAARVAELRQSWGEEVLQDQAARQELRQHAWRVARLQRMRELAVQGNKTKVVARIDDLLKREATLHEQRLQKIRARLTDAGPMPSASAPPSAPSAPSNPSTTGGTP